MIDGGASCVALFCNRERVEMLDVVVFFEIEWSPSHIFMTVRRFPPSRTMLHSKILVVKNRRKNNKERTTSSLLSSLGDFDCQTVRCDVILERRWVVNM